VADDDYPFKVEGLLSCQDAKVVSCASNVVKRARPATTLIIDTPILNIPGGQSCLGQRCCQSIHDVKIHEGQPTTSVNDDGHRKWPSAGGNPEVTELKWVGTVRYPLCILECGEGK
jgi:hypothetical protein